MNREDFKPGDRVKVRELTDWSWNERDALEGKMGTVTKPPAAFSTRVLNASRYVDVEVDGLKGTKFEKDNPILFLPDELEKI